MSTTSSERRHFLKKVTAAALGGLAFLTPVATALMALLDPLRRKTEAGALIRVTSLQSMPEDGLPWKFMVVSDRADAWNTYPAVPVGAVYLRRTGPSTVEAYSVICPHAGCLVEYAAGREAYLCPCHNSTFGLDGAVTDPGSPSPRGLDRLEVRILNETEVWVRFQNFVPGRREKIPVA